MATDEQRENESRLEEFFGNLAKKLVISEKTAKEAEALLGKPIPENEPIEVKSTEEAEKSDCVICGYPSMSMFQDDITTNCDFCNCDIIHRPHVPLGPPKACLTCAMEIMAISKEGEEELGFE